MYRDLRAHIPEEHGMQADKDWAMKVDADAVFLPFRLRTKLIAQEVTSNGIYSANCKCVNYGFFGNLRSSTTGQSKSASPSSTAAWRR